MCKYLSLLNLSSNEDVLEKLEKRMKEEFFNIKYSTDISKISSTWILFNEKNITEKNLSKLEEEIKNTVGTDIYKLIKNFAGIDKRSLIGPPFNIEPPAPPIPPIPLFRVQTMF